MTGLNPTVTVMCRNTAAYHIQQDKMMQNLYKEFNEVSFICTTADIWSSAHRSFMGMTAHWIADDSNGTLTRRSAAIACIGFKGSHTHDRIAEVIS